MKTSRILSISILSAGVLVAASASADGPNFYPYGGFPAERAETPTTRAQVVDELRQAQRLGQIFVGDDFKFVTPTAASSKTRAQVVAELHEAKRLGLLPSVGESNSPVATAEQERQITLAGLRAIAPAMATR